MSACKETPITNSLTTDELPPAPETTPTFDDKRRPGIRKIDAITSELNLCTRGLLCFGIFVLTTVYSLDVMTRPSYQVKPALFSHAILG